LPDFHNIERGQTNRVSTKVFEPSASVSDLRNVSWELCSFLIKLPTLIIYFKPARILKEFQEILGINTSDHAFIRVPTAINVAIPTTVIEAAARRKRFARTATHTSGLASNGLGCGAE